MVNVAPLRPSGTAAEALNVPRFTLAALGSVLRWSVPPAMVNVPSLSNPLPLSVIVSPSLIDILTLFCMPLPAVNTGSSPAPELNSKFVTPELIRRPPKGSKLLCLYSLKL